MSRRGEAIAANYDSQRAACTSAYLWDGVLGRLVAQVSPRARVLEAGCGNGAFLKRLTATGYEAFGFDLSQSGVELAGSTSDRVRCASVYEDMRTLFPDANSFAAVISLEVIEHLYDPRAFIDRVVEVLEPGGVLLLSTPYHGYLKNLALGLTGKMDQHFTALWDGGHIKFWSRTTLEQLLRERGLTPTYFAGVGRLPYMWKSMILEARKGPA